MHFYPFHISDYAAHTRHLTLVEDAIYRRMLDLYYLREAPLPGCVDTVARLTGASDYRHSVEALLEEFFELSDAGYTSQRADEEIAKYHRRVGGASKAGRASAERRANERSTDVEQPLNGRATYVQPTKNQEPRTSNQVPEAPLDAVRGDRPKVECPDDVSAKVWEDWLRHRKSLKVPFSATAMAQTRTEAAKAGMTLEQALSTAMASGWRGFRADYVRKLGTKPAEPPRNVTLSALPKAVLHDPDDPACKCERCYTARLRANGYGEQVKP